METFKYSALDSSGGKVSGKVDAVSATRARNELLSRSFDAIELTEKKGFSGIELTKKKVKRDDLMNFSRQLAAFLRAGIPILDALTALTENVDSALLRTVLVDIADAPPVRRAALGRDGRARRLVPELLHRHPALGRADRQPRLGARPARRLHRARSRRPGAR